MNMRCVALLVFAFLPWHTQGASITEDTPVYATKEKSIGTLRRGAEVTVLEEAGEFVRVVYETMDAKLEGYVKKGAVSAGSVPLAGLSTAVEPTPPREIRAPAMTAPDKELSLSSYWINGARNMSQSAADFVGLLTDFGSGRFQTKPDRGYVIYNKLTYLMPVADAIKMLGLSKVTAEGLKSPGLPADSFTGHSADGFFDGFSRLMLVSDRKAQLVAVQLGDRTDRDVWLRQNMWNEENLRAKRVDYSERWRVVSLLDGRMKGSTSWQIGYSIQSRDGVVRIDSEMLSGAEWQGRSKERYRTFMPTPVVDMLLQLVANRG
jgi:hypothetical protein